MRLHFAWLFRWSASILCGVLAVMLGCSPSPEKAGSSAAGPAAKPTTSTENPGEPAKPAETPAVATDGDEDPIPTTPIPRPSMRCPIPCPALD